MTEQRDATVLPLNPRRDARAEEPLVRDGLGRVLRRLRQQQQRTLDDVATRARVSMPYLSEIERGRKEASSEVVSALCGALGIAPSRLLFLTGRELAGAPALRPVAPGPHSATLMAA
ncbi:MAG: helix-turn-helix transcriptional regulator [Rhodococcus sp. (in: high G+C Gram-positive bacteria)]